MYCLQRHEIVRKVVENDKHDVCSCAVLAGSLPIYYVTQRSTITCTPSLLYSICTIDVRSTDQSI